MIDAEGFRFLEPFWPDLHETSRKAEQAGPQAPDLAAIRLRAFTESMVAHLWGHLDLPPQQTSQFDRLVLLEKGDLLDRRLLAKFHSIRRLGNNAAHNHPVTPAQVETMLEDAWSLGCWFCRFMRPDIEWFTPTRTPHASIGVGIQQDEAPESADRQSTASGPPSSIVPFPVDRIRRVREEVAKAMAQIDPRARSLRTRISMQDAFSEDLNVDQRGCLSALSDFLGDREQRLFLLKGYAGTGKTFLVKGITEYLAAQGRDFQLLAPTGRAANVMREKTGREARTLHGSIYDYSDLQEYRDGDADALETFKIIASIRSNRDQANTVYIVDEASLLADVYAESDFYRSGTGYLLQDLMTYMCFDHSENDRKIIFVGDPAQLPPVGMASSPALDPEYLRKHFNLSPIQYELKEVVRQKADSGLIRNVMPLRESLSKASFSSLTFEFGEDVARAHTDEVIPLYMAARGAGRQPIIITHPNAEAAAFNRAVREQLHPQKEFVTAGDTLIVTANAVVGGRFLANGEFVEVIHAEPVVDRRTLTLKQRNPDTNAVEEMEISLTFRDVDVAITLPDGTKSGINVKLLDDHLHRNEPGLSSIEQRALYIDFLKRHPDLRADKERVRRSLVLRQDPYFNALRAKFGYAVTCHKAQGGEWTDVVVSCPTGQDPRTAGYFRWLYTAMTRSSQTLHLVNPPEVRIKSVGEPWWRQTNNSGPPLSMTITEGLEELTGSSPQEQFRAGVLAKVRSLLVDTQVAIDDVAHHSYQEAYYLSRGVDSGRVNIGYDGKYRIRSITTPRTGNFEDELRQLFAPLLNHGSLGLPRADSVPNLGPTAPFLKELHDRLVPLLTAQGIIVTSLEELQWCQRYTFSRGDEVARIDIFYDGRNRIRSCMPLRPKSAAPPPPLLPQVMEILTMELAP
ncbi:MULTISPECIES: ATP-dependent RecD-like DNA helicase [unclassified Brevundimonas]|uniref:ATP-dependent DNA helicase n=1 Tax=unclassified Brevundimonas TaxID=2622653 RepID=UPI0006F8C35D|nr:MULTISPECIES: AAA family ATPase [unclassified Brevundimonas]KQY95033.1 hypothetical protein ASD25_17085 [Brevundimonas sp. Root1423]KRA28519.1 hypothetical protein ASD59_01425 [Brevundimonas sp. Root608]